MRYAVSSPNVVSVSLYIVEQTFSHETIPTPVQR